MSNIAMKYYCIKELIFTKDEAKHKIEIGTCVYIKKTDRTIRGFEQWIIYTNELCDDVIYRYLGSVEDHFITDRQYKINKIKEILINGI